MSQPSFTERRVVRRSFSRFPDVAAFPHLIQLQKSSYYAFLQPGVASHERQLSGLEGLFRSEFPVVDSSGRAQLEYCGYELEEPKCDLLEAMRKSSSYASALRVKLNLVVWKTVDGVKSIARTQEQSVYMGDIPLVTPGGTFVVNGTERVVVSQMHRSPGVFFDHDRGRVHASGKHLFAGHIIPRRGVWLDFEFDAKDIVYVRVDRKKKFLATTLLLALMNSEEKPFSREDILDVFYERISANLAVDGVSVPLHTMFFQGVIYRHDVKDHVGKVIVRAGEKTVVRMVKRLEKDGVARLVIHPEDFFGRYIAQDSVDEVSGEIYAEAGDEISAEIFETLLKMNQCQIDILAIDHVQRGGYMRHTLMADRHLGREEALLEIYRILRSSEAPSLESASNFFKSLFFDATTYDLSTVGRVKMNKRLGMVTDEAIRTLTLQDFLSVLKVLMDVRDGHGDIDDIDSLANRRLRSVGELLENQYALGLSRMERTIRERMGSVDLNVASPQDLVNAKPLMSILREFFGTSQLSQFMDQTNPLSEVNHKRRISALGPGGLKRERTVFDVRDVHPTHYGRICPIETPEGPNVGLINSLAVYARIDPHGFIETPYRRVIDGGRVTDEVVYLSAMEDSKYTIVQANTPLTKEGRLSEDLVYCRQGGKYVYAAADEVNYMDVSPKQIVSVAASLIPFIECDDATRALMGSNMQRQAVPLIDPEAPLVGTGMESIVARDSGAVVVARRSGVVEQVEAAQIVVRSTERRNPEDPAADIYKLMKFYKTNSNTCVNQRPLVNVGDVIKVGDIIADGASTQWGELALGRNVRVAFMSWQGRGFEDSIVVSEDLVRREAFSSIHIEEFEVSARDTKLGSEEITRDVPGVGDEALSYLDETGIVYIGTEVHPGDILVGRVTPKGENVMTPEEKLLRAIFGEKSADVRDSSLRVPAGIHGTVFDVRISPRRGVEKDERTMFIERAEIAQFQRDRDAEMAIMERSFLNGLRAVLTEQLLEKPIDSLKKGVVLDEAWLKTASPAYLKEIIVQDSEVNAEVAALKGSYESSVRVINKQFDQRVERLLRGDDLPAGVLKSVKVFIAVKRSLQPGDKMAGRHGNKGVVSCIVPVEDMPYLEDGTPVDMILNPLGLPSRMNFGQVWETHLGEAAFGLGKKIEKFLGTLGDDLEVKVDDIRVFLRDIYQRPELHARVDALNDAEIIDLACRLCKGVPVACPVFDGAQESDIAAMFQQAGLGESGQVILYDGQTGQAFDRPVTVGVMYMLKLHHLVDEKIHARSVGPYSLVTQQPLGGKAQFGGQRFGEMEVWALEAHGAAYTLWEMLTVKSDDVTGRIRMYESIIRGESSFEPGVPESFNVLVQELRALGLNMECLRS